MFSGGAFPYTIGRIEHGFNVRPDLCAVDNPVNPRKYLGRIFTDSLVHDDKALRILLDVMGSVSYLDNDNVESLFYAVIPKVIGGSNHIT